MSPNIIRGAGGGGVKGGEAARASPVESADSLRSRQYARVLDLVSEGEIVGLVDGLKSVYLDNTPVQNADGSYNFSNVSMATRVGTQSQSYVPGFDAVESETAVLVKVLAATPVVRSIANANADAVRVTVSIPALTYQVSEADDTGPAYGVTYAPAGSLIGASVDIAIDVQDNGGGYVQQVADTITGKTTGRYKRSYRIGLTGTGPWDVRVRRITADSVSAALNNATFWDSYTEIIDAKLRYPNSALVGLSIDSERFNSIPTRGFELLGMKVRVPANYNPETRVYTGVWNGTFTTAWTDNPAWCFYDLITNARYGLGGFVSAAQVDKWALYSVAQYCDQLVSDGFGGLEPRFTCSLYLQSREEAYKVVNDMAAMFCGICYWGAGTIVAVQDAPADPVAQFTQANVIEGRFNYSGSSLKTRHTVALVSWNDPDDRYKQKIEYVEDLEGIAQYGIVQTEVVAMGCTSRGQAHRYGRRILYTERMATETVSFKTGLDGLAVAPGDIIQTSDSVRAGVRMGGRLVSCTTSAATLDAPVELTGGVAYTLWAVLPDGTVQSRAVTAGAGTTSVLDVIPAFTTAPQAMAMWVLAASNLAPELWRVLGIAEAEESTAEITALKYSPNKYAEIESGIVLEALPTSSLTALQPLPTNLLVSEELYLVSAGVVGARVTVAWTGQAARYELQYRVGSGNWATAYTTAPTVDIEPAVSGRYEFVLYAYSTLGVRSVAVTASREVYGKTAPPADIANFSITKVGGVAIAVWVLVADLDVRIGGRVVIRHSPLVSGATWQDGIVLEEFNGDAVTGLLPLITGTYMAKAKDSSAMYSAAMASFVATEGMVTGFTTVATSTQSPVFAGAKTSVAVVDNRLLLDTVAVFDGVAGLFDSASGLFDSYGGYATAGTYLFDTHTDLGTVATRRIEADISVLSFDSLDLFDDRPGFFDDNTGDFDGAAINDCDATLYYATTNDNPAGSPVWGPWTPFFVADITARAVKFRLDVVSGMSTHNIAVSTLAVDIKTPV